MYRDPPVEVYHWRSCVSAIPSRGDDASRDVVLHLVVDDATSQFRRNLDATVTYLASEKTTLRADPSNND